MIDVTKLVQTKAFARQDGAILGAVWIVSFALTMWSVYPEKETWGLIANLLMLSTPFVVAKRLKSFRDTVLNGSISFRRSLFYCMQTFFNATLLLTIVQYLWFRYLDTGLFLNYLQESYRAILVSYNTPATEINTLLASITELKPIAWAATFMITDMIAGTIFSPIIAGILSRKHSKQQTITNQQ